MFCMGDGKLSIAATFLRTLQSLRQILKIGFKKTWTFHSEGRDVCFQRKKISVCWISFSPMLRVGDPHKVSKRRNKVLENCIVVWSLKLVHAAVQDSSKFIQDKGLSKALMGCGWKQGEQEHITHLRHQLSCTLSRFCSLWLRWQYFPEQKPLENLAAVLLLPLPRS